jgi:hypothetical protein
MREKKRNELQQVWDALVKREKPLSPDEIHLIWTCCYILMADDDDKVNSIATKATIEVEGDTDLTVIMIPKLLEALRSVTEACRRAYPAPHQTTQKSDNLDALARSFEGLYERAKSLKEALQQEFVMVLGWLGSM